MKTMRALGTVMVAMMVASCGSNDSTGASGDGGGGATSASGGSSATGGASAGGGGSGGITSSSGGSAPGGGGSSATGGGNSGGGGGAAGGAPTAAELLALLQHCDELTTGRYKSDDEGGSPANIPVCKLTGAVFWQADMDIDCDGKRSAQCNIDADPDYQNETAATDSHGDALDAAKLPYVVVPSASAARWDYHSVGLRLGDVIAVIYQGKVSYGVFGDTGPNNIIGESSYAMAQSLGIDPDPSTGGAESGVSYIAFPGAAAVVSPIEDHAAATALGESLATQLIADN